MITKSDFLAYIDAPIHMWASKNNKLDKVELTALEKHKLEQGYQIEQLAEEYITTHILSTYQQATVEFQRVFETDGFLTRTDAIVHDKINECIDLYEIKSINNLKKEHIIDVAYQRVVCEAIIPLRNTYLVHLNKEYVFNGELNIKDLFVATNVNERVKKILEDVRADMVHAADIANNLDHVGVSPCRKPKTCPSISLCHPEIPEYSIYDIPRLHFKKLEALRANEISSIKDIPDDFPLTNKQAPHVTAMKTGVTTINSSAINEFLSTMIYPISFLDYETFSPAIPVFQGYRPYQAITFQFSLHVINHQEHPPMHFEFIGVDGFDPAKPLLEKLTRCLPNSGSVVVWNKSFEMSKNRDMASMFPEYAEFLLDINERIIDLMDVFKDCLFVHPDFHGSSSIKKVLPVVVPELSYGELAINAGEEAMMAWWGIYKEVFVDEEKEEVIESLLTYCKLDTWAMVRIWQKLQELINSTD